jgi:hypothetical protein
LSLSWPLRHTIMPRSAESAELSKGCDPRYDFVVPEAPNRTVAWYVWWVGTETGLVRRDAMISRSHYMASFFSEFDTPFTIDVPETS